MANDFLSQILKNRQQPVIEPEQPHFMDQLLGSASPLPITTPAAQAQRDVLSRGLEYNSYGTMPSFPPEMYEQELAERQKAKAQDDAIRRDMFGRIIEQRPMIAGMADSLEARSGNITPPEPGMAESLPQRSGDDIKKSEEAGIIAESTPFRKEEAIAAAPRSRLLEETKPDTELEDAQRRSNMLSALMMAGKGAERIGSALAYQKHDPNYLNELQGMINRPVEDVFAKRRAGAAKLEQDMQQFNFAFAKDKDDPTSNSSNFYRQIIGKYAPGIKVDGLSASEIEKVMPTITNMANAELAREARLEAAHVSAAAKKEKAGEEADKDKKKFTQTLRKELTAGKLGDLFANVTHAQKANDAIAQFMKNPTGYSDYGTLMTSLKTLQGDQSVVREAEIRLGMQAGSFKEKILNQIDAFRTGKSLQPGQRQNILNAVKVLNDIAIGQYKQAIQPQLEQAKIEGIDPKLILPGNVNMEDKYTPAQEAGITQVMEKNKIDRDKAINALKEAGKL